MKILNSIRVSIFCLKLSVVGMQICFVFVITKSCEFSGGTVSTTLSVSEPAINGPPRLGILLPVSYTQTLTTSFIEITPSDLKPR